MRAFLQLLDLIYFTFCYFKIWPFNFTVWPPFGRLVVVIWPLDQQIWQCQDCMIEIMEVKFQKCGLQVVVIWPKDTKIFGNLIRLTRVT